MICMYVLNLDDQYAQVARVKMHFGLALNTVSLIEQPLLAP